MASHGTPAAPSQPQPAGAERAAPRRWGTVGKVGAMLVVFSIVNLLPWIDTLRAPRDPRALLRRNAAGPKGGTPPRRAAPPIAKPVPKVQANRGMALLEGYTAQRADRACAPLASNVTIALESDFELGMQSEVTMPNDVRRVWHKLGGGPKTLRSADRAAKMKQQQQQQQPSVEGASNTSSGASGTEGNATTAAVEKPKAYVLMVSNHKYVDGALVMGASLRNVSKKVRSGECELVILVSDAMQDDALRQLAVVFDRVKVMRTLGRFAKKSAYTNTFDKAYLWFLLEYEMVMFLDADHLAYTGEGIDALWARRPLTHSNELMAVGDSGYFQTALMILRPNRDIFVDIYLEFRYGTFGYNQWRARDGILIRNCFLKSVRGIGHPQGLFHFYGFTKPWMNNKKKPRGPNYQLQFDKHYRDFWRYYEQLHDRFFVAMATPANYAVSKGIWRDDDAKEWIKSKAKSAVRARDFMWIQRFSGGSEYLRPTTSVRAAMSHKTLPSLEVYVSHEAGASCDAVCKRAGTDLVCRSDALLFSSINSDANLRNYTALQVGAANAKKIARCEEMDSVAFLPYIAVQGEGTARSGKCVRAAGDDVFKPPLCNASAGSGFLRVCPCVQTTEATMKPLRLW